MDAVARLLERGVDLEVIVSAIVDEVKAALAAERCTLYLVDAAHQEIFSRGAHLPELREIRLPIGRGVAGDVARTGVLANIPEPYDDPRFDRSFDVKTGYRTRSILAAPVADSKGRVIGVLQVLNRVKGAFSDGDEETLTQLAHDTASIIERTSLHGELTTEDPKHLVEYRYNHIVGASPAMRQLYTLVDTAASTLASVLLLGETGTGKSLVARAIHLNGARAEKPLVTLDCTALPPSLIESELFGHERGAFTGAEKLRQGRVEQADGGTLFIDELGDLPLHLQGKLLRVIQERSFERVGGSETLQSDFRLISATHRDLEAMVRAEKFRADLYYRVRVIPMVLPPLRERGDDDLVRLAGHFLRIFAKKHDRSVAAFSAAALARLKGHDWPGNIRELENCIETAVVLAGSGRIEPKHLPLAELTTRKPAAGGLQRTLHEVERDHIAAVLADCAGNQSEAARRLGISRNTLVRKLR